jgi:hypothetical protein
MLMVDQGQVSTHLGGTMPAASAAVSLPDAETDRLNARLTALESACGCGEGAAVSMASTTAYALWAYFGFGTVGGSAVATVAIGVVIFVVGTGLGKAWGLKRARSEVSVLERQLAQRNAASLATQ